MATFNKRFYEIGDIIYYLVLLNTLWLLGSILGLGIFGFFPALQAAMKLMKEESRERTFKSISKLFLKIYKRYFWRANAIGYINMMILGVIALDLFYWYKFQTVWSDWVSVIHVLLLVYLFISALYHFYYSNEIINSIKESLFQGWRFTMYRRMLTTKIAALVMLVVVISCCHIGFWLLISVALICYIICQILNKDFQERHANFFKRNRTAIF